MIFMQTFEGRNRSSKPLLYGGKGSVWVNPKIGEFYHITYEEEVSEFDEDNHFKIGKIIGIDMRSRFINFTGINGHLNVYDTVIHEFNIRFNNNQRICRLATKEEIARFNKAMTIKRFDL